ncbi:MAG: hypothetical protein BWY74_03917 [Firmicutes bacterium ADurb.Bin419]|nr:MAG: hypothetical protein BWY74_03917 [Firmicutes bacterium ADurb.Bin419]
MHSKYNPVSEAENFAKEQYKIETAIHILYGFGVGYHINEISRLMKPDSKLYILENNLSVFYKAIEERDLTDIFTNPGIELIISGDAGRIANSVKSLINEGVNFIIHPASLKAIPFENEYFRFVMEDWNIRKSISEEYLKLINDNLKSNLQGNNPNVGVFFEKFKGIPVVIVSTGPSLDENIDLLKEVKGKALIFAVGSALRPLLVRNIVPDLFIIIDPKNETLNQIKGFEDIGIPMIYLSSIYPGTVLSYNGPKFIACYEKGQLKTGKDNYLIDPGGSVSTTALDIAIKMGCSTIILIGQDLAFIDGKNHAKHGTDLDINTPELKSMRRVRGQNGEMLYTTLGLLSYKYWIEKRIEKENRLVINASEGGAIINGMKHIKLKDVITDYLKESFNIKQRIKTILEESGNAHVQE